METQAEMGERIEGMGEKIATRSFTDFDQQKFAALSGDVNPMHMDPIAARRVLFGAPVVHGVHVALWMLDEVGRRRLVTGGVKDLQVRFGKPIPVGSTVTLSFGLRTDREITVKALVDGIETTTLKLSLDPDIPPEVSAISPFDGPIDSRGDPVELGLSDIEGRAGTIAFAADFDAFREAFPEAEPLVGAHRLRGLAALSRLVGMECPGLHSIFASIRVELTDQDDRQIDYRVESVKPRINMVEVAIDGAALRGRVQAFLRPKPTRQLSAVAVAELSTEGAYAGHHALIVGGSRGLGELAAKLVAGGGGSVTITYAVGKIEAAAVAAEINAAGGSATTLRYDASSPAAPQLDGLTGVTHVYYFATPRIVADRYEFFDAAAFDGYADIYVKGFHDLVTALQELVAGSLRAFYPSTVYIDQSPKEFGSYVAAKAAGEALCAHLTQHAPAITALAARLPRMPTDQTASLVPVTTTPAIDVMRPLVEIVQLGSTAQLAVL
jgi:acyl dehydratase/NAD(P)-dependent dehydrogenase (short-subunit alcohol dehydrogenase family)